jgi:hypothetical protein
MAMSGRADSDSGVAIKQNIAVNVSHPDACATFSHQFEVRPGICRIHKLRVGGNDRAAFRTGQFGFELRPL